MRQSQIFNVSGEIALTEVAAKARIKLPFFRYAGNGQSAVVVSRIEKTVIWQREYLLMDRAVHRAGIALLKVRAATTADEQAIAREGHAPVIQDESQASAGVAGRRPDL